MTEVGQWEEVEAIRKDLASIRFKLDRLGEGVSYICAKESLRDVEGLVTAAIVYLHRSNINNEANE